jgi:hypothetical protein
MSSVNTKSKMRDRDLQKKKIFNSTTSRDFGITHPAIKKPVTIQVTAELMPA